MACESKKISELTEACQVNPNDILPIVQDGTNKYVKVKDLLKGKCGDDTQEDDCCCSKALSKAVTALDFSRTAMDLANKAFDKACQVDTKLGALEQRVTELEQIICNIQSQITQIFNRFDQLEDGLTVTVVTTSETTLDKHEIKQGGITKGIIQVLRPTSNINQNGQGLPADAWQVRLALDGLKSEVTKNLTFVSGKFNNPGLTYNGTSPVSVNIPTALSQLDNDGNFLEGVRGHDGNLVQVVNHIAELGPLPTATSTVIGGIKVGYSQSGKKYPVKLDSNNKAYIDLTNLPTGAENLDDLGDVDLTSPQNGDILYFDGTNWINVPFEDLIGQNCEAIKACFSTENFNVAPLVVTLEYNERVANFAVTSSGAWKIQKVTSGDNVFTASIQDNVHQNPGTHSLDISAGSDNTTGQDREVEWDVIPWITVPGLIETQRIKVIQKAQAAPPTPTEITVTPTRVETTEGTPISTDLTASTTCTDNTLLIDSTHLVSGITATVTNNNTKIHVEVAATVPAGTYSFTVSDNCGSTPVTVTVKVNPVGQVTVTYVGSNVEGLPSGNEELATIGSNYTRGNIQPASGYRITNVGFTPTGGTFNNGTVSIPNIQTNVTVEITTEAITPGTYTITYTGDTDKVDTGLPSGNQTTVSAGSSYSNTITPISGYQFSNIGVSPSGTGDPSTGDISISQVNADTTITITASQTSNIFDNLNFGVNKLEFNAFGVVEERFVNSSTSIPLDPAVSNPYEASTYTNGAPCYEAILGTWDEVDDALSGLGIADVLSSQYQQVPSQHDLNWFKDPTQVQARLAELKEHLNLDYTTYAILQPNMDQGTLVPAEYGQKQSASNDKPFYLVVTEDTSSIQQLSDAWDANIKIQLWCQPTDFSNATTPTSEVTEAHYEWRSPYAPYSDYYIGIAFEKGTTKMETYLIGLEREAYKLHPGAGLYQAEDVINNVYYTGETFEWKISDGSVYNNSDYTVSQNPTIAAFTSTTVDGVEVPYYNATVIDGNGNICTGVQSQIVHESGRYYLQITNFPQIETLYKLRIVSAAVGGNFGPDLQWECYLFVTETGTPTVAGVTPLNQEEYANNGGYFGDGGISYATRHAGVDSTNYSGSTSNLRIGSGYAVQILDNQAVQSITITTGSQDERSLTISRANFYAWGSESNYRSTLDTTCAQLEQTGPLAPPAIFYGTMGADNIIEIIIPFLSTYTKVTFS